MAEFMFQNVAYRATVYRTGEKEEFYGSAPFVCLLLRIEQNQGHLNEQVIFISNLLPTIWIIEGDGRN